MTDRHLRYCLYGLFLGIVAYGFVLGRLAGGNDFLNSYPFIRADGFDWFYQGAVVYERLLGHCAPVLWFLRDPGFVLVCALDAALRAGGLVVILAHTLSFFVTGLALLKAARLYALPLVLVASVTLIVLVQPLNCVRLYVLWPVDLHVAAAELLDSGGLVRAAGRSIRVGESTSPNVYSQATMPDFGPYPGKIVSGYLALRMKQQDRVSGVNSAATTLEPGCR